MGAKTPEQTKKPNKPRPPVNCDVCGRKFLNVSAWKSHYKFLHAKTEPSKRVPFKKQENEEPVKKKMVPLHMLKRVNPPQPKEVKKIENSGKPVQLAAKSPNILKKPEFECPVCSLKFPVYFTAFRHIQKNHCIDDQGDKVPPNSPHLVKPVRIETCASCSQEIRSTIPHDCPKMQAYKDQYLCLACDQVFCGLVLFQHHVKGLHADEAQNYFFPSRNEFESWKTELEETINLEFVRLNKQKGKEIYHCSHQSTIPSTATRLCPASIIMREYSRGIHVCYFTEHCGHRVGKNVPLKNHNQYSISLYTKETADSTLEVENYNDLYKQFKNMIMCIMNDAAKTDASTLRDLLGRALEMTTVLKNFHGEDHSNTSNIKSLSDDQISNTLGNLKPKIKRKQSFETKTETVVAKKIKKTPSAVENGVTTRHSRSSTAVNKSVSFNKSVPKKNDVVTTDKELQELLEEDIGYTPKKIALKKTDEPLKGVLKKELRKAEEPRKVEEPVVKKEELPARSLIQSPSSFNDSYKHFVDKNFKSLTETSTPTKTKTNVKKKEVMKTKIGQFKVKPASPKAMSPKSPKIVKEIVKEVTKEVPVTPVPFKAKPDIKYVVKEQENDCNILILKI